MALYVNAILWSVPYVRGLSRGIVRAGLGNWVLASSGIFFGAVAVASAAAMFSRAIGTIRIFPIALVTAAYVVMIAYLSAVPDEISHLAEYGLLALLVWRALGDSTGAARTWLAIAATGLVSLLDEITQAATPERYFDWRDVFVNVASGALPLWLIVAVRRDRPAA